MVCLFGCRRGEIEYPFPKYRQNPKMFVAWIKALQNTLSNTLIDVATFEQIKLCAYHFRAQDKVNICNKKLLLATAIPQHSLFTPVNLDHSYNKLVCLTKVQPEPTLGPTVTANKDCGIRLDDIKKENDGRLTVLTPVQEKPETPEVKNMKPNNDQHQLLFDYNRTLRIYKKSLKELTFLRYKLRYINNVHQRLQKKKGIKNSLIRVLNKMTPAAKMFTLMQLLQHKSIHGRRFADFDKLFALTLLETSSNAYELVAKYFTMPSIETLRAEKMKYELQTPEFFEQILKLELEKNNWEQAYTHNTTTMKESQQDMKVEIKEDMKAMEEQQNELQDDNLWIVGDVEVETDMAPLDSCRMQSGPDTFIIVEPTLNIPDITRDMTPQELFGLQTFDC